MKQVCDFKVELPNKYFVKIMWNGLKKSKNIEDYEFLKM